MTSLNDIPLPIIFNYDGKIIEGFLLYVAREDDKIIWGVQDKDGEFEKYDLSKINEDKNNTGLLSN